MRAWIGPAIALVAGMLASGARAEDMPKGFVYLADIDPTIAQDMRYAGKDNFTHAPVPGYRAGECVLNEDTAQALAAVQSELAAQGFGLLVYDCYRPAKAVKRFVQWASEAGPRDPDHNPRVARNRLLAEGYIGRRSGHSSGGTVDLTLTRDGKTLEMGTGFDFFDPLAFTGSRHVSGDARINRKRLLDAMAAHGFRNYRREWWHFHYVDEPFSGRVFDFDILPRKR